MMSSKNLLKWLLNFTLCGLFLTTFFLDLTGVNWHQWLGLMVGILALFHLLNHWQWVKAVSQKFFHSTSSVVRINYLLDVGLAVGMGILVLSGLAISTWFGVNGNRFVVLSSIHKLTSVVTLGLLILKLVLHWKSITKAVRQLLKPQPLKEPESILVTSSQDLSRISRREALRTIGMISVVGSLVMVKAITSLQIPNSGVNQLEKNADSVNKFSDESTPDSFSSQNLQPTPESFVPSDNSQTTPDCSVRCPNGCSYPGRCRRYVDGNKNGKCDLGECL